MAAIVLTLAICFACATVQAPPLEPADLLPPVTATVTVNTAVVLRASVPTGLFGTNVEWIEQGNGIADSQGSVGQTWTALAKDGGLSNVRWPGGIFSDYYHWLDGTGNLSNRPVVAHPTDTGSGKDVLGTAGIVRWARSFGGDVLITVNAGTGTAQEAAGWVRYANATTDSRRTGDGFSSPLGITYWEVGNELYLPGNPGPYIAISAADYTQRFLDYAQAMRAASPGFPIKLLAIAPDNSSWYPVPDPSWPDTLLNGAASSMDMLAVHNAYFPVLYNDTEASRSLKDVYCALWAAPDAVGESLDRLTAKIAAAEQNASLSTGKIGLAVTEWGTLFGSDPRWVDHGKTMGSAVYVARMLQVFMERERVRLAEGFKFSDSFSQGWVAYDGLAKPVWQAFGLMSRLAGKTLVTSAVQGSRDYVTGRVGGVEARTGVQELTSVAALSTDNKHLYFALVNRAWNRPYDVSLSPGADWGDVTAHLTLLSSRSVTDHNGPDVRSWIPASMYVDPPRNPESEYPIVPQQSDLPAGGHFSMPPFSVAIVEFDK